MIRIGFVRMVVSSFQVHLKVETRKVLLRLFHIYVIQFFLKRGSSQKKFTFSCYKSWNRLGRPYQGKAVNIWLYKF